jgi:hypothetical protein
MRIKKILNDYFLPLFILVKIVFIEYYYLLKDIINWENIIVFKIFLKWLTSL